MRIVKPIPIVAAASLCAQFAVAGDAEYGRTLAENWCTSCHAVSADQPPTAAAAPSFTAIAQSPDFSADRLSYLLLEPHPKMAKLSLSRRAIEDIAAYIVSLRR